MKRWAKAIAAFVVASFALVGTASAQEMKFFKIGTGGTGGTYYPIGGLIANAISNPPGSRPCDKGGSCGVPDSLLSRFRQQHPYLMQMHPSGLA